MVLTYFIHCIYIHKDIDISQQGLCMSVMWRSPTYYRWQRIYLCITRLYLIWQIIRSCISFIFNFSDNRAYLIWQKWISHLHGYLGPVRQHDNTHRAQCVPITANITTDYKTIFHSATRLKQRTLEKSRNSEQLLKKQIHLIFYRKLLWFMSLLPGDKHRGRSNSNGL